DKEIAKFIGELRQNVGDYLLGAHDAKPGEEKAKFDLFAVERKLIPAVLRRWITDLEARSKKSDPIYTPWFELSKLAEPGFATNARPLLAKFSADSALVNPAVAKAIADRAPESLK